MAQTKEERRVADQARYRKSDEGKAAHACYCRSNKGKATIARYRKTDNYRAARCRYFKTEKGKKFHQVSNSRYQQLYPDRVVANNAVKNAIRAGRLTRQPCEVCQELTVQAHHPDYAKPLDVQWLCPKHHRALHQGKT